MKSAVDFQRQTRNERRKERYRILRSVVKPNFELWMRARGFGVAYFRYWGCRFDRIHTWSTMGYRNLGDTAWNCFLKDRKWMDANLTAHEFALLYDWASPVDKKILEGAS